MRWDHVVESWCARMLADPSLRSVMGANDGWIYPAQAARPVKVPSIEYVVGPDVETELFNGFDLQVDFWAKGLRISAQIERRLRLLTHWDTAQEVDGERQWWRFKDKPPAPAFPAEPGVVHSIVLFEFEVLREKYATW